jgi:hypothetical protein
VVVGSRNITAAHEIKAGHKIALDEIPEAPPSGNTDRSSASPRAAFFPPARHTHNVVMKDFERDYQFCAEASR